MILLGKLVSYMPPKGGINLPPYTKVNSKWDKNLDIKAECIKYIKENISRTLSSLIPTLKVSSMIFIMPLAKKKERKVNNWDIKLIVQTNNQKVEWKQLLSKSGKGLKSKIYKALTKCNNKTKTISKTER